MRFVRDLGLAAIALVATSLALLSWHSFVSDFWSFSWRLAALGVVVCGLGTAARALRAPWAVTLLGQLVAGFVAGHLELTGYPLPVGRGWSMLHADVATAATVIDRSLPPVPASHGIAPLLLAGALLAYAITDLVAVSLRRPALAGLPLLAVYAAGFGVVGGHGPWLGFVGATIGFLALVFLGELERVERWGRRIGDDTGRGRLADGALRTGLGAGMLALLLPLFIPVFHLDLVSLGPGSGSNGTITVTNPMVDVQQSLNQGADTSLIELQTQDPDPSYLRIAVLTTFSKSQWTTGARTVPPTNSADGPVPVPGLGPDQNRVAYPYSVQVLDSFRSRWLPTRAPISSISADGDWRYDSSTLDFLAVPHGLTTAGESYQFTALSDDRSGTDYVDASPGTAAVGTRYLELPSDFPRSVVTTAQRVTQHATTPFAKAVALQDWFRSTGDFHYSTSVNLGSGAGAIATFVGTGPGSRVGYCQQFAAAMASMARALGIPARIAVGFLHPTPIGPTTWLYRSHDMHAWPELYFNGLGWVRFEPTPAQRTGAAPSYTRGIGNGPTLPPITSRPSATASPSTATPRTKPHEPVPTPTTRTQTSLPWTSILVALAVLAIVGLALVPAAVRRRRRQRRSAGAAEAAWAELRDTARDLGLAWPAGRSPRVTALALPVPPEQHATLLRLVEAVEVARYSPRAGQVSPADLREVLAALETSAARGQRLRARWWPRSLFTRVAGGVDALVG